MADWTPQQLQQMNAVVMGSHDKLTPGGQIQPGYTLDQIYGGIFPATTAARPTVASNRPTPAQLAAMQSVPAGSYQTPANRPVMSPNTPAGSQFANTGNYGRATPEMQQLIQLATAGGARPGWTIPQAPVAPNVPLPRARPGYAPSIMDIAAMNRPVGANPGMGGALLGNGVMSPSIPPQGPPPPGVAPTFWADDPPPKTPVSITVRGGQPGGTVQRANGTNGYVYGRSASGPWYQQGSNRAAGIGPAQQYAAANLMGQVNALNRQAAAQASGQLTPVQQLQAQGLSPSQAYAAANAGPGSVAAFEQRFAGGGQSGAPAVGGSYGGGASNSGSVFEGGNYTYRGR